MNSSRTAHAFRYSRRIEHLAGVRGPRARRGFTLIEMLVALVITLIMMGSVVTLFGVISDSVSGSRSLLEMTDRLRAARNRLQLDLQGATATMKPPLRPESDEGYFEVIEGPDQDKTALADPNTTLFGDADDVLVFTVRSRGEPFTGKVAGSVIESQTAEVIYFTVRDGPIVNATTATPVRLLTLYRRVLLVAPQFAGHASLNNPPDTFYRTNDLSAYFHTTPGAPPTYKMVPNTLGDLTKRENRFAHFGNFPFRASRTAPTAPMPTKSASIAPLDDVRLGDDVLMTNVLAFDVQLWDPHAPLYLESGVIVEPHNPTYDPVGPPVPTPVSYGAYVDLGYAPTYSPAASAQEPYFHKAPADSRSGLTAQPYTYDTWSLHYENDGINQDNDDYVDSGGTTRPLIDEGTNGLDDDGNGVVDDLAERETAPPYGHPLRGIRITIRAYEPSSQQVREVVVVQDFLPE